VTENGNQAGSVSPLIRGGLFHFCPSLVLSQSEGFIMAKVIENGRITSVVVEHVGSQFNIWRFDRDQREYEVFCNQKGDLSITFSGEDADELQADLKAVSVGSLSKQALEGKLAEKIDVFLGSIKQ
jgi:hypothetical protein